MEKQEILDEIKRTSKSNNGKALGLQRFERATGIKRADWWPHHWLRWSDALIEAGLAPNQLNVAISNDEVILKLIALIKEIGRFPVEGEIRLKKIQDPTFPTHQVFDKFGGRKKLATSVMAYCRARNNFEDVIDACVAYIGNDESESGQATESGTGDRDGFVYLMKSGRFYKIGRTDAVGRRHKEIKIQLPEATEIVHYIETDDPSGIEAYWHKRFESKRKNGEWFDLTRADINAFKRRKKFM